MVIGIDMGHKLNTGASKILNETTENRAIGNELIAMLKEKGHTVINCTSELSNVNSQLSEIAKKANAQKLDVFCSIHLNAGGGMGTETYIWNGSWSGKEANRAIAKKVNDAIVSSCNFRNRGVKEANFYVLQATVAPAILVEVCFVDSSEDANKLNRKAVAKAIFKGLTGVDYVENTTASAPSTSQDWANTEIKRYSENGICYPNTTLNFRDYPSTKTGKILGQYYNGESVRYDLVVITNGYTFISWIGASSGTRRYMAITDRQTGEKWGKCV